LIRRVYQLLRSILGFDIFISIPFEMSLDCGTLNTISNGTLQLDSNITTYGATATVNCSIGYHATVESVLCNSSGLWGDAHCKIKGRTVSRYNY
jgi:hypothetical protein